MADSLDAKNSEINNWQKNIRAIFSDRKNSSNQIEYIGTGFLIKYADRIFFITAKHVIDGIADNKPTIYVSNADYSLVITMKKTCFQQVSQRLADEVEVDFVFADVSDNPDFKDAGLPFRIIFDANETNNINHLKVVGFPASKNTRLEAQQSAQNTAKMYEYNGKNIQEDSSADIHFIFDLPIKGKQNVPSPPKGCSGGPVFAYNNDCQAFIIYGLFIEYKKDTEKATAVRLEYILKAIDQYIKPVTHRIFN
ncbi:MAG: hypothetical protein KA366_00200 [Hydromonas sp.]|nr:hypothetical protein [Hydromonas sp.]